MLPSRGGRGSRGEDGEVKIKFRASEVYKHEVRKSLRPNIFIDNEHIER